jgi:hypothetical protein
LNTIFTPGLYKIFGEASIGPCTWTSVNDYPLEFANVFCTELNSVEIGGEGRIRYSLLAVQAPTEVLDKPLAKSRYPKTKKAEQRLQRLLDAVEKKG